MQSQFVAGAMCIVHVVLECFLLSLTASLLKGLKHANIVTLHDIIHVPGNLTFVFEYVVSVIPCCYYIDILASVPALLCR